ncbi:putative disease resistance protein RGA3 [Hordeum vulgare subsp. vulgare]|uniref:AAA+ ATPase domain-containing protein n=1 Tax=Hordeum vulgare subsp. vulgare TaxID=112509 RepID=A0A8I6YQC2_HORVV|nr:putative disease resistance protein RGA3 [Hordeum vulgare subsp. vulgare]
MLVALSAAQWVVGKALAPIADGLLEAWGATKNLSLNIEALRMELLLMKATLELAGSKQIQGQAMEELLGKLRHLAHCAEDLLDELDYFRIHDELHGMYDAADQHAKGCVHDFSLNARHTAKAVGKLVGLFASSSASSPTCDPGEVQATTQRIICCAWPHDRQRSCDDSSLAPNANQVVSGCMPKLGKLLLCSSSPHVCGDHSGQPTLSGASQRETPLGFNRVDVSERMKCIVQQLQPVRREVTKILQSCDRMTVPDISESRPITTGQSTEQKLYGRDHIMHTIIHDMTKGKYCSKDLTVLPVVGPGGIGKTTLVQYIYRNQQVQNHFQVLIWVCVSLSFNLSKLLDEIKTYIPRVEGEKVGRVEELIEQRLKSKRFLLVLDDIWEFNNGDDWKRLLLPFKASQEKGSMILLTTRFPAIANMGKTADYIELEGLESEEFRKLFLSFVFVGEPFTSDHSFLLETGDKIMEKLKGSPLAAKTVGTLLRKNLNLRHWRRVLESKEWERQTGVNDIMSALKLSYYYLPFHQRQCFSYSALFPEDYKYSSTELINLWIGLDILQACGPNQTLEDIGLSNLNDLVTYGFFKEEKANGRLRYVMHDLLHDLALHMGSHEYISLHRSNVGSVQIKPSIRHLSIIIDDDDTLSQENFKGQLRKLKTILKVKQLHSLMLFGEMDESFASILGDLFREANGLRVLRLVNMPTCVEYTLHNFSALIHLRYLCLGTKRYGREMQLPLAISKFYHLRILDLASWYGCRGLPRDLSKLAKLRRFYTPSDEIHSDIYSVGKLRLLEELKVFRLNKEREGFEAKQLEHLTELRELGMYNLENIHTKEEAAKAKLIEKNYLERLTLDWDSNRSNTEPCVEEVVLETLQPHRYLQELCIRGHGGSSCPTWLGDKLVVEALQSLQLAGVSWQCLPSLGKMWGLGKVILKHIGTMKEFVIEQSFIRLVRLELVGLGSFEKWIASQSTRHMFPLLQAMIIRDCPKLLELPFSNHIINPADQDCRIDWFPKLQELEILYCPEFLLVPRIPWTETLCSVNIRDIKLLEMFKYSRSSYYGVGLKIVGKDQLQSLDQVLAFNKLSGLEQLALVKCPPLELKHLLMLTSLKKFDVRSSDCLVGPLAGEDDVEWQHPMIQELLVVQESLGGPSGKELTELLTHLPRLSQLLIASCENITQLSVGLDVQQTTSAAASDVEQEKEDDGLLLFPAHLCDSLRQLVINRCPELVMVEVKPPSTCLLAGGGGFQALRSLQSLRIFDSPKVLSANSSFSCRCIFPSSLQVLELYGVEGMGTLEPLSNLTSLTRLKLCNCGEDLRCKGLGPLLGHLKEFIVFGSPRAFAGWDPNPRQVLQHQGEDQEEVQQLQLVSPLGSSQVHILCTDEAMGLLAAPICSLLSSSLTCLHFHLLASVPDKIERFTKEQEDALHLLASLQELEFWYFDKLQSLPAGLQKLTNLQRLQVRSCPSVRSLPKDGLPKSLQALDVQECGNEELIQQCRGLVGTIPKILLQHGN